MSVDAWDDGRAYEHYVGRWSRLIATHFVRWLGAPAGSAWLDFGCGSGALTHTILTDGSPRLVIGCDRSAGYIDHARQQASDPRAQFIVADLDDLPRVDGGFDVSVSGLVLNFLPNPGDALGAIAARVRPRGTIAAYVWDYGEGMQLMRAFWDAVLGPSTYSFFTYEAQLSPHPPSAFCTLRTQSHARRTAPVVPGSFASRKPRIAINVP